MEHKQNENDKKTENIEINNDKDVNAASLSKDTIKDETFEEKNKSSTQTKHQESNKKRVMSTTKRFAKLRNFFANLKSYIVFPVAVIIRLAQRIALGREAALKADRAAEEMHMKQKCEEYDEKYVDTMNDKISKAIELVESELKQEIKEVDTQSDMRFNKIGRDLLEMSTNEELWIKNAKIFPANNGNPNCRFGFDITLKDNTKQTLYITNDDRVFKDIACPTVVMEEIKRIYALLKPEAYVDIKTRASSGDNPTQEVKTISDPVKEMAVKDNEKKESENQHDFAKTKFINNPELSNKQNETGPNISSESTEVSKTDCDSVITEDKTEDQKNTNQNVEHNSKGSAEHGEDDAEHDRQPEPKESKNEKTVEELKADVQALEESVTDNLTPFWDEEFNDSDESPSEPEIQEDDDFLDYEKYFPAKNNQDNSDIDVNNSIDDDVDYIDEDVDCIDEECCLTDSLQEITENLDFAFSNISAENCFDKNILDFDLGNKNVTVTMKDKDNFIASWKDSTNEVDEVSFTLDFLRSGVIKISYNESQPVTDALISQTTLIASAIISNENYISQFSCEPQGYFASDIRNEFLKAKDIADINNTNDYIENENKHLLVYGNAVFELQEDGKNLNVFENKILSLDETQQISLTNKKDQIDRDILKSFAEIQLRSYEKETQNDLSVINTIEFINNNTTALAYTSSGVKVFGVAKDAENGAVVYYNKTADLNDEFVRCQQRNEAVNGIDMNRYVTAIENNLQDKTNETIYRIDNICASIRSDGDNQKEVIMYEVLANNTQELHSSHSVIAGNDKKTAIKECLSDLQNKREVELEESER